MRERLIRLEYLLGEDNIKKLNRAKVAIVGLGGVGSVSAITLARSGIGNFIIQDFDVVNESNFNRQVIANTNTLNALKTDSLEKMILEINPNCNIIKISSKYDQESNLFEYEFDYLIDAIDDVSSKVLLIKNCLKHNKVFISSMGTAKKMDIKKLQISEIKKTEYDPLAKVIRKRLRDDNITEKVNVLYSSEEVTGGVKLGSYMPVTATAGLMLADFIIKKILE